MIYTIQHNGESVTTAYLPEGYSLENIKTQCAQRWPEVANATIRENGGVITFSLPQGQKA